MANAYHLDRLAPAEACGWDRLIAPYSSRQLFHRSAWLDYLSESRKVEIGRWTIRRGPDVVGYFCAGLVRKGPFRILGSPLKSWGTNFMGPLVDDDFDQASFLEALGRLALDEQCSMTEIEHPMLSGDLLAAARYEPVPGFTYVVTLTPEDPEQMWNNIYANKRNRIRKAIAHGLRVEDTDEPAVADEFYDRYLALMRGKGLVPPYPREYARSLVRHLKKAGCLLALRVRDRHDRVLATGLFPHDDQSIFFWGGSSWPEGRELNPNDFLQWSAMRLGAERGLRVYNMCGYGRFKKEFGGRFVTYNRWHRCYSPSARWARRGYELYYHHLLRMRGLAAATWPRMRVPSA
jgi:phosphoglycolate phosphatase-like HAD superfamily hydrolase